MQLRVNRYLRVPAMDHIDHALGRPLDPMAPTYRNHYAAHADSVEAGVFRVSKHWRETGVIPGGLICFQVTDEGRVALKKHLALIADPHRAYAIEFDGHVSTRIAKSPGAARYDFWADVLLELAND